MASFLHDIRMGIAHLFYPSLCEGCRRQLLAGEDILCVGCAMELPVTGYHNSAGNDTALRFAGRIPFVRATSFAYFTNDGLLQHLLHGLKYGNKPGIGTYLGWQFGHSLQQASWAHDLDLVIPVPLHSSKQAKRGYNQSMLIAQGMASVLGIPASDNVLARVRATETQTNKTRTERVDNMKAAFSINDASAIVSKHILICDDVLTTGATIEACAQALLAAEGTKISIATIGIAVS